jgi:hypothetical protein
VTDATRPPVRPSATQQRFTELQERHAMTETSEHGFKSGHSEGERTRGNGLQRQQRASPVRDVHRRLGNEVGLWFSSACGPHIARCSLCCCGCRSILLIPGRDFAIPDVRTVVSDTLAFLQNYRRALVETPAFARMQWEVTRAASLSRSRLPVARLDGAARRLCKMNKGTIMLK